MNLTDNSSEMQSTLADSLDVLLGAGTEAPPLKQLVEPDRVSGLKALAGNLAPILRGGFECRLGANAPQVDLQQCIVREESELALLRELAGRHGGRHRHRTAPTPAVDLGSAHLSWSRLNDFLDEWQSSLESIFEIWLEFDTPSPGSPAPGPPASSLPLPAIFFGLPQEASPAIDSYEIAAESLDLLLGREGWREWQENIYPCFAACSDRVFVSHIGAMLSRNFPALRVNVKRLQPDGLVPYLQELGWQGETQEVEALMAELFALCDRITVCLDVGDKVYPQIGLECIFVEQPQNEPRWRIFLDYLVERGLCYPKKREALLDWPGQSNPVNSPAPWPRDLIAASLLQPRDRFTIFDRRLSHIKISWRSQQSPLEAKAYLWFEHRWL